MSASEISEQSSTQACESVSSFDFTGTGMDLFILYMKNFILTLITCGLYFPWAKTNIRKFTLSHIKLQDDYFEFTGTGKEVFFGLLKIFGFILLFVVVMMLFHLGMFLIFDQFLSQENSVKFGVPFMTICQFTVMFFCTPFLILGAGRYFLSRIKYRNILFTLEPIEVKKLLKAWFVTLLKLILTGGLYSYVLPNYFFNILVNSVSYGGKKFSYTGLNQDFFLM